MTPPYEPFTTSLIEKARELGFSSASVVPAVPARGFSQLKAWIERGYAGKMQYIPDRLAAYEHPSGVLHGARSVVMLTMNYLAHPRNPAPSGDGFVSCYAWGTGDYHSLIRSRLRVLVKICQQEFPECHARGIVDTAPFLERDFAQLAGLGWIGKHTLLLNRQQGSWFFLAGLLMDVELSYSATEAQDHCGTCTACLDACPTAAFPEPYVLDATRCISYLTIEHRGHIARELRPQMGNWVFGCDICQEVCPWNRRAPTTLEDAFAPQPEYNPLHLRAMFAWDEARFKTEFRGTPLVRPGRRGLLRNAAIALGNAPHADSIPSLRRGLSDNDPVVRAASAWSLGQHAACPAASCALQERLDCEQDPIVVEEIKAALAQVAAAQ
jgi:epoxyqueuosine reductase